MVHFFFGVRTLTHIRCFRQQLHWLSQLQGVSPLDFLFHVGLLFLLHRFRLCALEPTISPPLGTFSLYVNACILAYVYILHRRTDMHMHT